jgi:protein-ribulosamine 3-kinase
MLPAALTQALQEHTRRSLGNDFRIDAIEAVGGGDINPAFRLRATHASVFAKIRPENDIHMFVSESEGLDALRRCPAFRVPRVLATGKAEGFAFLLLEWLDITPIGDPAAAQRAGEALAILHRNESPCYGWPHDNFIGSTPQHNVESINWARFFIEQRLMPQFEMAFEKGHRSALKEYAESIYAKLPVLFLEYRPTPSLLHGDLWSGNLGTLTDGTPVLFDPACYYGDRETDLAMTELFGGLPLAFYAAYRKALPLNEGYERRKPAYNLYHILNHLNLFGRSYLGQAERLSAQLARELGH